MSRSPHPTRRTRCAFSPASSAARVIFGGQAIGFRPMQVWLGTDDGDGMPVELLEPWDVERNDFLARFVARHGAGPHHLTFKVPDLARRARARAQRGLSPGQHRRLRPGVERGVPHAAGGARHRRAARRDARHPRDRAQNCSRTSREHGPNMHPRWWVDPAARPAARRRLRRVVLRTPRWRAAVGFFARCASGRHRSNATTRGRSGLAGRRARRPRRSGRRVAGCRPARGRGARRAANDRSARGSCPL